MKCYMLLTGLLLLPILSPEKGPTVELTGKVVHITDGDTVGLLVGKQTIKIRLEGIDAPESKQAFGTKSKEALAKLIAEKDVTVIKTGEDRYKRTLGTIYLGQANINQRLVADGWAWHYKKYSSDKDLAALEIVARDAKRGLWADSNPLPLGNFGRVKRRRSNLVPRQERSKQSSRPARSTG